MRCSFLFCVQLKTFAPLVYFHSLARTIYLAIIFVHRANKFFSCKILYVKIDHNYCSLRLCGKSVDLHTQVILQDQEMAYC